jgi:hypothetical protein
MLMLSSVSSDCINLAIVSADGESKSNDIVALTDEFEPVSRDRSSLGGFVEEHLNILQEAGLFPVGRLGELSRLNLLHSEGVLVKGLDALSQHGIN